MADMVRRLIALALVVAAAALPARAQRGGARGGGGFAGHSGGGFAGRSSFGGSAPAFRGGFGSVARPGYAGAAQYRGSAGYASGLRGTSNLRVARPPDIPGRGVLRGGGEDYRYRRPYLPLYGVEVPYGLGWLGPDCIGFVYCDYGYDDSAYAPAYDGPLAPAYYPADDYGQQQAEVAPGDGFRPPYQPAQPQPEPEAEQPVTLVFKDGRPSMQVRNYILTRTTLYVQDAPQRQIPVDLLDMAATVKANSDAGIAFQLPLARQ
jgi:hypothetical protein